MLIAALILYVILAFVLGPVWPLELAGGKAGPLGYILLIGWAALIFGGMQ